LNSDLAADSSLAKRCLFPGNPAEIYRHLNLKDRADVFDLYLMKKIGLRAACRHVLEMSNASDSQAHPDGMNRDFALEIRPCGTTRVLV
jgi:hypothetical protein